MSEEENTPVEEEKVVATASVEEGAEPEKKKEVTAEDLLKSDLDGVKIRRAKGSKNITSGIVTCSPLLITPKSLSVMHVVMSFLGQVPASATSVVPVSLLPTLHKSSLKMQVASLCHTE